MMSGKITHKMTIIFFDRNLTLSKNLNTEIHNPTPNKPFYLRFHCWHQMWGYLGGIKVGLATKFILNLVKDYCLNKLTQFYHKMVIKFVNSKIYTAS